MPKTEEILYGLQNIVNDYHTIAIIWHVIFFVLIAAIVFRWRPTNRFFGLFICAPILSVATLAFLSGNPFNGMLFLILVVLIFLFGLRVSSQPVQTSHIIFMVIGILMIVFGLIYPHFVITDTWLKYLYASPVGLIPCPTLSLIIGFLLLFNGFGSKPITLTLIVFGLFYGLFGFLKLGVNLDIVLVFGTVTLLVKYLLSLRS